MTLRLITENHALSLRKHLITIYNPTTVNIRMRALKTAFNWALGNDRKYVDRNPFAKIKQIKVDKKAIRYLDPTQIKKFFDAIDEDGERSKSYGRYARFLLFTGCRRNEGLDLTWDNIDFQNKWILFEKTKSGDYRNYPMNDELLYLVNEIKSASLDTSPTGRLFDFIPEDASRRFRRFRDKAELPKYLHLHSLRHTNAMLHRARGTHILDIKDLLGHASLSTTQIYTKSAPELLRNVVSKLNFEPLIGTKVA
jgi:integrase